MKNWRICLTIGTLLCASLLVAYWQHLKNQRALIFAWSATEDVGQTLDATAILDRWSKGKIESITFGGGTISGAKKDAIAIGFITGNSVLCIHIPSYQEDSDRFDVRFSVHPGNGSIHYPEFISHSIKDDKELRMAFLKMLEFIENDKTHPSHREVLSMLNSCVGERTWQDHQW